MSAVPVASAPEVGPRGPGLPAFARVVERELRVFSKLWRGSLFSTFVNPILFLLAMGVGVGGIIDDRRGGVGGVSYLAFIVPGIMVASSMQAAAGDSLWGVMAGVKWMRHFHAMTATPLSPADVFAGKVVWTATRIALSSSVFLLVATAFGGVTSPLGLLAIPAAVLTAATFAAAMSAYAATQETEVNFSLVFRLGVIPLFLFSGTFFPVSQLPDWAEPLSRLSPLYYGVELARMFTTGQPRWGLALLDVAVLVTLLAIGWRFGTRTFTRRLAA